MYKFTNLKFYTLCRHKLNLNKSDIYSEVKDIQKEDSLLPPECMFNDWINTYNKETNPVKKDKLISLSFKKDSNRSVKPEPKVIQKSKLYAAYRFKLLDNHQQILEEIKQLFKHYLPTLKTIESWYRKNQRKEKKSKPKLLRLKNVFISNKLIQATDRIVDYERFLKHRNKEFHDKNLELSAEVEQLNLKLTFEKDLAAANTSKLDQKNIELQKEILSLRNQLSAKQNAINDQESVDKKIHDLAKSNRQMYADLDRFRQADSIKEEQINNLKKDLSYYVDNTNKLKRENEQYLAKLKEYEQSTIKLVLQINELKQHISKQASDKQRLETELSKQTTKQEKDEIVYLKSEIARYSQESIDYLYYRENDRIKISDLNKFIGDKDLEIKTLKQASIEQFDRQAESFQQKINHQIQEKNAIQFKCTSMKEEIKKLNTLIEKAKFKENELHKKLNLKDTEIIKTKKEFTNQQPPNTEELKQSKNEIVQPKDKKSITDQNSKSCQTDIDVKIDLNEFQIKTAEEISNLNDEIKRMKNEDTKKRIIIEFLGESFSKHKAEANNLRIKNNKLSKELKYLFNTCKQSVSNASNSK